MKILLSALVTLCTLALGVSRAEATPFDFTALNGGVAGDLLLTSVINGGVTATGWAKTPLNTSPYTAADLWLRNNSDDRGLGVCSEGHAACVNGAGDVNELSNQLHPEMIRLARPTNTVWSSLWVSSLDSGGSGNAEKGTLTWSNNADLTMPTLGSFTFQYGDFGTSVEGNLLSLTSRMTAAGWVNSASYLFLTPGPNTAGTNNDYLVWKGVTDVNRDNQAVPEPASLVLFGTGLVAVARKRLRKRQ